MHQETLRVVLTTVLPGLLVLSASAVPSGTSETPLQAEESQMLDILNAYLEAHDVETALDCLSPDFRLFFESREGDGITRASVVVILGWDFALNHDVQYRDLEFDGRTVTGVFHEDNDFSRLLEFPGWDAHITYRFDDNALIAEQLWVPFPDQPDYKEWLNPALGWIRQHHPEELQEIYRDDNPVFNRDSAKRWTELLREWREATGQPAIR